MKILTLDNNISTAILLASLLTVQSQAALHHNVATNPDGTFANGSWTPLVGTGTVQPSAGGNGATGNLLIDDFGIGILNLGNANSASTGPNSITTSPSLPNSVDVTTTLTLNAGIGGTGDLNINTAGSAVTGYNVTDLTNTSAFSAEFSFSRPVGASLGPQGTLSSPAIQSGPFLAGMRPGNQANYDIIIEYLGIESSLDGVNWVSGLPVSAQAEGLLFNRATFAAGAATGIGVNQLLFNSGFQGIHGFDVDPADAASFYDTGADQDLVTNVDPTVYKVERVRATGVRFTLQTPAGLDGTRPNFTAADTFLFSTNGTIWGQPIPEPSSGALVGLGALGLLARRRRK